MRFFEPRLYALHEGAAAQVATLDGLGHWWMLQDPHRAAELLRRFWATPTPHLLSAAGVQVADRPAESLLDERDQQKRRQLSMPVLAAWQDSGGTPLPFDPQQIWSAWAPDLRTQVLPCGHFLPEEEPEAIAEATQRLVEM